MKLETLYDGIDIRFENETEEDRRQKMTKYKALLMALREDINPLIILTEENFKATFRYLKYSMYITNSTNIEYFQSCRFPHYPISL